MKTRIFALLTFALLAGSVAMAQSVNISNEGDSKSCSDIRINFDDAKTARAEQHIDIPRAEITELEITASHNGGISVSSWDREDYGVTLCKAAGAESESESQRLLAGISIARNGSQLSVNGPGSGERWVAFFLINAPKGAALNLHSNNGPVTLRGVNGNAKLDAHNGPIQLEGCTGTFTATAKNGPIQMNGETGSYDLRTQNGPIQLKFSGRQWQGGAVTASAQNGPVQLTVPSGFESAFVIEGSHAPVTCRADVCTKAQTTLDEGMSRIAYGTDPKIRASSHNGPISVRNASGKM